ncbi:MAG TPA: LamG-like jellyroll fold domain-containing protein [Pseudosphingobacterium sp.]|nr:LamG-like jellyroll fold domain-containing protein [Pseudosphingobacterium sp.]
MKHLYSFSIGISLTLLLSSCDKDGSDLSSPMSNTEESNVVDININNGLKYYFPFSGNTVEQVSNVTYNAYLKPVFYKDRFNKPNAALCMVNHDLAVDAGFQEAKGSLSFWVSVGDYHPLKADDGTVASGALFARVDGTDYIFSRGTYRLGIDYKGRIWTSCRNKWGVSPEEFSPVLAETPIKTAEKVIELKKWYHIVVRWSDENETMEIFVNNKKELAANYIENWGPWVPVRGDRAHMGSDRVPIGLGRSVFFWFQGVIDEVRGYNRWINNEEIATLYADKS